MVMRLLRGGTLAVVASEHVGVWAFDLRPGTVDVDAVRETWTEDVYQLATVDLAARDGDEYVAKNAVGAVTASHKEADQRQVVVDVGAHIGAVAVWCALAGADVIAVEPDVDNLGHCERHLAGAPGDHALHLAALTALPGDVPIRVDETTRMAHVMSAPTYDAPIVTGRTLEDLITEACQRVIGPDRIAPTVRLVKVDVEGDEYAAITACPPERLALVDRLAIETHAVADPAVYGGLIAHLSLTHSVRAFGRYDVGGMIHARRYGH